MRKVLKCSTQEIFQYDWLSYDTAISYWRDGIVGSSKIISKIFSTCEGVGL